MPRLARVILPGYPHHIIQRGNRCQDVFFCDDDYIFYLDLLKEWCKAERIEIWAYCLMTNHVHLILKPGKNSNLSKAPKMMLIVTLLPANNGYLAKVFCQIWLGLRARPSRLLQWQAHNLLTYP